MSWVLLVVFSFTQIRGFSKAKCDGSEVLCCFCHSVLRSDKSKEEGGRVRESRERKIVLKSPFASLFSLCGLERRTSRERLRYFLLRYLFLWFGILWSLLVFVLLYLSSLWLIMCHVIVSWFKRSTFFFHQLFSSSYFFFYLLSTFYNFSFLPLQPSPVMEGMPYDFQYGVQDPNSGNSFSHVENSDGRTTQGEYRVLLPDGRTQVSVCRRIITNGKYLAFWCVCPALLILCSCT